MPRPQILFGTSQLGVNHLAQEETWRPLLEWLIQHGVMEFDSAALYPVIAPGTSETTLGKFLSSTAPTEISIDSKILITNRTGEGCLGSEGINSSVAGSLERIGQPMNILYCHAPDTQTPVAESVAALLLHKTKGSFKKLGLSNYSVAQIDELSAACRAQGLDAPRVFQGQYNALCRGAEADLLPYLREHGMQYIAYSPLAGGFLTGKLTNGQGKGTRFDEQHAPLGVGYRKSYDKSVMHDAVRLLQAECETSGINLAQASLRWLLYHSALGSGDGIILGATRAEQVRENVEALLKNDHPLPEAMVQAFERAWDLVKAEAP